MEIRRKKQSLQSTLSHPGLAFVVSVLSLVGSIFSAACMWGLGETARVRLLLDTAINGNYLDLAVVRMITRSFALPWLSAILGPVVGIPFFLICKRILRAHVGIFAALDTMPIRARLGLPVLRVTSSLTLFILLPVLVSGMIAWHAEIAVVPACLGAFVPYCMLYPEHRRIYDLATASKVARLP